MSDKCSDLDAGHGVIDPGCGASYTVAQLHLMCCKGHRTASVAASSIHDRLRARLGRCPTDVELGRGKSPLHQDDSGVWRMTGPDREWP